MSTINYLWTPPAVASVPVRSTSARYPVNRIFLVGRNYQAHAVEMGAPVDKASARPMYFTKSRSALVESGATVPYPPATSDYHYEMELVVALGAPGFRVAPEAAGAMIYGYACGLDMTRRDLQAAARAKGHPWDVAKNVEQSAVISEIVPASGLGVLSSGAITLSLNGETRQSADLSALIWSLPELIADLSTYYHLAPGDLIYTGTPEGVGPVRPGDRLHGRIAGVGEIALTIGAPE